MRIVHVSPSMCRQDGGPTEVLRGLLPELVALGHSVTLVTTDKGLREAEKASPGFVEDTRIARWWGPYSLSFAWGLPRMVREAIKGADVVHVHGVHNYTSAVAVREAVKAGVPCVLQPHGAWNLLHANRRSFLKGLFHLLFERSQARALGLIVSSAREYDESMPTTPSVRRHLATLGVDSALFQVARTEPSPDLPFEVLFLGRVAPVKRVDLAISGVARARSLGLDAVLTIAGPVHPRFRQELQKLATELHINDSIRWEGMVGVEQRTRLLARAAVFVLLSDDESFGLALAEAAAAGLPVIASPHVGLMAQWERQGLARSCPQDVTTIAERICSIAHEPSGSRTEADNLRAHMEIHQSWSPIAAGIVEFYSSLEVDR